MQQSPLPNNEKDKESIKIYPTPKSFDELEKIRKMNKAAYESRKPRYIIISTSIRLYSVIIGLIFAFQLIPYLIHFNIISGVFLGFLVSLILLLHIVLTINHIESTFYKLGFSARPFLLIYTCSYSVLVLFIHWLLMDSNIFIWVTAATLVHHALVYALIITIFKSDSK